MSCRFVYPRFSAWARLLRRSAVILGFGVVVSASGQSFSNPSPITLPTQGIGSPYPSVITASGVSGTITKLTVTLKGVSHTFPDDLDVLLVGPTGLKTILVSDVGGSPDLVNLDLTLDDSASTSLPDATQITGGTYKPTNIGTGDAFTSPAPAGPYGATLAAYVGTNPNGNWSLYVLDDDVGDSGSLSGGWSIAFNTSGNTPPTITDIPNMSTNEDTASGTVAFTIGDAETAAGSLVVTGSSSDTTLVPNANIVFGGSGTSRTVTVTPGANRFGAATITVTVSDGVATATDTFVLTVNSVNDLPTLSTIGSQITPPNTATPPIPFTVGDVETAAGSLTLSGTSSNPTLVPSGNISFGGSGANRTVTVTPVSGQTGTTTINLTVHDANGGTATGSFLLAVNNGFGPLTFANTTPITIPDSGPGSVYPSTVTVAGMAGTIKSVTVSLLGLNHTWPDDIDVLLVGPGGQKLLLMSDVGGSPDLVNVNLTLDDAAANALPDASQINSGTYKPTNFGGADTFPSPAPSFPYDSTLSTFFATVPNGTWLLYVVDGASGDQGSMTGGWSLTVTTDANSPPTVSTVANQTIAANTSTAALAFTVGDSESTSDLLVVSGTSSSTDLVPNANIVFGGSGSSRTVTVTPLASAYGTTTISLKVTDPQGLSSVSTFVLTVNQPVGGLVKIASTSWSLRVDANNNGYFESSRLNWNPDVVGGGSFSVFEKVYARSNTGNWVFFSTTSAHSITGTTSADSQFADVLEDATKVNAMLVDYKIELYRVGQATPDDVKIPANDSKLNDVPEEGLPDLTIYGPATAPTFSTDVFLASDCAVGHGCVVAGTRRIMRFGMQTRNIGTTDLFLGDPVSNPSFVFDPCHGHYHFQGFATYRLLQGASQVAAGNKVGFCLEDVGRFSPTANVNPKYVCSNQGIQAGWYDYYGANLTCQWIDITGVPPGSYNLEVAVNPLGLLKEADYANNAVTVPVTIVNTMPSMSGISSQSTVLNTPTADIPFSVWDAETALSALTLSATSSDTSIVPVSNITFGGSGGNRTVKLTPAFNHGGTTTINVVLDDTTGGKATNTFILNVGNDIAPVLTLGGSVIAYVENGPQLILDPGAKVTDSDSTDFSGGSLVVDIVDQGVAEDRLDVRNQGTGAGKIGVSGSTITFGGVAIATKSGGTSGLSPLVMTFTSSAATPVAVQTLLTNVYYLNVSENPSVFARTVRFVVDDGDGGFSAALTKSLQIVAVNDDPVITLPSAPASYIENSPPIVIDTAGTALDVDSANFELGYLKVSFTSNGTVDDRLWIQTGGQVSLSGNFVSYAGILIGTYSGGTSGSDPLIISFDVIPSTVTPAVGQDLMRSILFSNVSDLPSILPRTVQFELADGDGGATTANHVINITATPDSPVVSWGSPASIAYGIPLSAVQLNATANVPGSFLYTPSAGTVLPAGLGQILFVTFTPNDLVNYVAETVGVGIDVLKATPVITWNNPANIPAGTALSAVQLNATANVPGSFVYTPPSGTVLSPGNGQVLSVTFTPTDTGNFNPASATVLLNVVGTAAVITWNNPADITYGTALSAVQLNAIADVPGTFVYTPAAGTVLNAGNGQILSTTFTPDDLANYSPKTATVTLNVLKATPTVTWADPADITYGTPLGAVQLNATTSLPGAFVYTPPAGTVMNAGNGQILSTTFTPTDLANYLPKTSTVTLNVQKATPVITWNNPDDMPFGTALGASQLNATANVGGSFVYTPAAGTVLGLGDNQTLSTTFTPTDLVNYLPKTATVTVNVVKATPVITWANPPDITPGTPLGPTQLNATANVLGTFVYTPAEGTILPPGAGQTLSVTFTPDDLTDYTTATKNVLLNVVPPAAAITWSNPADITYGTALSPTQLNATALVPGTFVYTPAAGVVLNAGASQTLSVTFTPTDLSTASANTKTVNINVLKSTPPITWNNPADIIYGTPLSGVQLNATAPGPGSFVYVPAAPTVLAVGNSHALSVTFTPTDTANYNSAVAGVTLKVTPAPLTITADGKSRIQGVANPPLTASYAGFVNGDTPASLSPGASLSTTAVVGSPPGGYPITVSGAVSPNYAITFVPGTLTVTAGPAQLSFTNSTPIVLPTQGIGNPYPSVIAVSGMATALTKVTVSLRGVNHTFPDDIDVLLVGPTGVKSILISDVGGSPDLVNVNLTLDDAASASLPDATQITSGTYKPTNIGTGDPFTAPAPSGPYGATFSAYVGTNPNGNWSLYVLDDDVGDSGSLSGGWSITINTSANTPPTISDITNLSINEDTATTAIPFTVGDAETAAASLVVTGGSSDTTIVPNANIVFGGSGASRTVTVTPAANRFGPATITVSVNDGLTTVSDSFVLTVTSVNDSPTVSDIANQSTLQGVATPAIAFTVGDLETAAGSLTLTGTSSNTALVPNANITFGGTGANRTVTITPVSGQTGTSTISVTVHDANGGIATDTFVLTVTSGTTQGTFGNATTITIPGIGASTPYPSTIAVSGLSGNLSKVVVKMTGINHTFPDDLDALLVGPTGVKVVLMSDNGGDPNLVNVNLTFDDSAAGSLPDATQIATGTFKPTNIGTGDSFPAPAPAGPYSATLSAFVGTAPNGTWSLYVADDEANDSGNVVGGWSLTLTTSTPPPPLLAELSSISIVALTPLPSGQIRLTVQGQPGQKFVIEYSNDLSTWSELGSGTMETSVGDYVDDASDRPSARFYRVNVVP